MVKITVYTLSLSLVALLLLSCATLPKEQIDKLANCDIPLSEVRRKLLKNDYTLLADEKDFINTDFQNSPFEVSTVESLRGQDEYKYAFMIEKTSETSIRINSKIKIPGYQKQPLKFHQGTEKIHKKIKDFLCF